MKWVNAHPIRIYAMLIECCGVTDLNVTMLLCALLQLVKLDDSMLGCLTRVKTVGIGYSLPKLKVLLGQDSASQFELPRSWCYVT